MLAGEFYHVPPSFSVRLGRGRDQAAVRSAEGGGGRLAQGPVPRREAEGRGRGDVLQLQGGV